jgi:hypothetical protein
VQEQSAAGSANFSPKPPPCTSVSKAVEESESKMNSMGTAADPSSGRLGPISSTNSKPEALGVDDKKSNTGNEVSDKIDSSMRRDADGDGLVDGLDKKPETRAEIAARKVREMTEKRALQKSFRKMVGALQLSKVCDLFSDRDAKNFGEMLGQGKGKGAGEFDFSKTDPDNKDNVKGVLGGMAM